MKKKIKRERWILKCAALLLWWLLVKCCCELAIASAIVTDQDSPLQV